MDDTAEIVAMVGVFALVCLLFPPFWPALIVLAALALVTGVAVAIVGACYGLFKLGEFLFDKITGRDDFSSANVPDVTLKNELVNHLNVDKIAALNEKDINSLKNKMADQYNINLDLITQSLDKSTTTRMRDQLDQVQRSVKNLNEAVTHPNQSLSEKEQVHYEKELKKELKHQIKAYKKESQHFKNELDHVLKEQLGAKRFKEVKKSFKKAGKEFIASGSLFTAPDKKSIYPSESKSVSYRSAALASK